MIFEANLFMQIWHSKHSSKNVIKNLIVIVLIFHILVLLQGPTVRQYACSLPIGKFLRNLSVKLMHRTRDTICFISILFEFIFDSLYSNVRSVILKKLSSPLLLLLACNSKIIKTNWQSLLIKFWLISFFRSNHLQKESSIFHFWNTNDRF